jgi:hypothetical protein
MSEVGLRLSWKDKTIYSFLGARKKQRQLISYKFFVRLRMKKCFHLDFEYRKQNHVKMVFLVTKKIKFYITLNDCRVEIFSGFDQ